MAPISLRRILLATAAPAFLFITSALAHEWHQHGGETGAPFTIPESEGEAPANSEAAAKKAEAFTPFLPDVRVRWDSTWFYIESNGIADHEMMTGITNWQQQIPVPQPYFGNNAWQIPLSPQPAVTSTPISASNLLRGAYAISVNGIPVFNLFNNRGENTLDIGELDQWGGHCGRADDYHYHIIPYHLASKIGDTVPLAYGLDGYPVYGAKEPDGGALTVALDSNQGHDHGDIGYHYHALASADYSITGLHGVVSVSGGGPENQIEPQPRTSEFRPALTPLRDASITAFSRTSDTSLSLTYAVGDQDYFVNWSTDSENGTVTYEFVNPTGTTSQSYNGWQDLPELLAPTLSINGIENGLVQFEATGSPNMSYPFSWSTDLQAWERFGFLQFDSTGSAMFDLEASDVCGFLKVEGAKFGEEEVRNP